MKSYILSVKPLRGSLWYLSGIQRGGLRLDITQKPYTSIFANPEVGT